MHDNEYKLQEQIHERYVSYNVVSLSAMKNVYGRRQFHTMVLVEE